MTAPKKETLLADRLTESGIKAANSIFTSCIIIRNFLEKTIGIDEKTADADAMKIVATTSEKTVNGLAEFILKG